MQTTASAAFKDGSPLNIALRSESPSTGQAWVYEEKVDGWRILAYKDGPRVRLLSRNGIDHARRFREIVAAVAALPDETLVLDDEVAIFDQGMRSRFDLHPIRPSSRRRRSTWPSTCSIAPARTSA